MNLRTSCKVALDDVVIDATALLPKAPTPRKIKPLYINRCVFLIFGKDTKKFSIFTLFNSF